MPTPFLDGRISPSPITDAPHVPGGTYFFTVSTYRRQTFLTDADFQRYVKQGWLPVNWGSIIESLNGADFGE